MKRFLDATVISLIIHTYPDTVSEFPPDPDIVATVLPQLDLFKSDVR